MALSERAKSIRMQSEKKKGSNKIPMVLLKTQFKQLEQKLKEEARELELKASKKKRVDK